MERKLASCQSHSRSINSPDFVGRAVTFKLPAHSVGLIGIFIVIEIQVSVVWLRLLSLLSTLNCSVIDVVVELISFAMMRYYIPIVVWISRHVTLELLQRTSMNRLTDYAVVTAEVSTFSTSNAGVKVFHVSLIKQCSSRWWWFVI